MASVNKVIIIGNLGKDPDLKFTPSGMAVASFSVATTSKQKGEDVTEWHRVVVFDKQAESCGKYLSKGKSAYVEGRLQTRHWDDKETGAKRSVTEIIANQVVFLSPRDSGSDDDQRGESRQASRPAQDRPAAQPQRSQGGRPAAQQSQGGGYGGQQSDDGWGGGGANYADEDIPF